MDNQCLIYTCDNELVLDKSTSCTCDEVETRFRTARYSNESIENKG